MEKGVYEYDYPRPSVTTDCVIFGYDVKEGLSVLLVERGEEPFAGQWAFPGGFLRMDETTEACALRELQEETGLLIYTPEMELSEEDYLDEDMLEGESLTDAPLVSSRRTDYLNQLGCFSEIDRDPRGRVITVAYYALVVKGEVKGNDDARKAQWFPLKDIPTLAFDHERILRTALRRLKEMIHFRPIGFDLMPEVFTLPQLQSLYEAILEVHFDRRNFAQKMDRLGILQEVDGPEPRKGPRNPKLYRFNEEKYAEMKEKSFRLEF